MVWRAPGGVRPRARATGLRVRTRPQARLDALLHFLRHGRLPWQGRGDDPAALMRDSLREDPAALAAGLRAAPDRAALLRRLAAQFDEDTLAALVHACMPGEPAAAARLLAIVAQARRDGRSPRTCAALWESVLGQAMDHAVAPRPAALMLLRAQLLAALDTDGSFTTSGDPLQGIAHAWTSLLREDRDWLRATLQRAAETVTLRERLAQALPEALLPRLLGLWMAESQVRAVADWIATVAAGDAAAPALATSPSASASASTSALASAARMATAPMVEARRRRLWQATLGYASQASAPFDAIRYEARVREDLTRHTTPGAEPPARWYDRVVRQATAVLAAALGALRLPWRKAAAKEAAPEAVPASTHAPNAPNGPNAMAREAPPAESPSEVIAIDNAGLVLLSPYLPRLFSMLDLADDQAFIGPEASARAALLLQALATGEAAASEPALVLNKLLCGLPLDAPLPREITPTEAERTAIDGLLGAVIQHWRILGSTSPAGLRDTFLRRAGRLERRGDVWQLVVEPGPFDMLIDQLPWGYATLRHPWMERVIHVDWR